MKAYSGVDAGYTGIENREEIKNDEHLSKIEYRINKRKGAYRGLKKNLARLYMLFCSATILRWSWSMR